MGLIRSIAVLLLAFASLEAFARGALGNSADVWSHGNDDGKRAKSVLEKGYAPPEKITDKKSAGADDADLLLGLMADVMRAENAAETNAPSARQKMPAPGKPTEAPAKSEEIATAENPIAKVAEVDRVVTNVVEKVVEKPVEGEKIVTVDRPVTNMVEIVKVETVEVEKPVTNVVERFVEIERPVTNVIEKVVEKPVEVERIVERQVTNTVEVVKVETVEVEKPVTNVIEKVVEVEKPVVVERTNVVEKVVYDRSVEVRLAKDKEELERRGGMLEAEKAGLEKRNEELKCALEEERRRRERLENANPGLAKKAKTGRPARITSKTTYYSRKKGVAIFEDGVHVDDEDYQLHADKAFVFTSGSNDVRRIVAVGHVAMTNEMRRAYGGKASYYRQDGMVVLYAGDGVDAEIRDESKAEDQTVRGSKIKFWIGTEQVEVLDATISAPTSGTEMNILGH